MGVGIIMSIDKANDARNVVDKYKGWKLDLIKEDLNKNSFPYAVCMAQLQGDFTFGSVVRTANFLGAKEVFYYGKKHYDKRSTCGTSHYTHVKHLSSVEELSKLKQDYVFVGLENNIDRKPQNLLDYSWSKNSLILIGEEGCGLSNEVLDLCDDVVEIVAHGSVRSVNAAVAGALAMYDYVRKF